MPAFPTLFLVPWVLLAQPAGEDPAAVTPPKLVHFVEAENPGIEFPEPVSVIMRLDIDVSGAVTKIEVTQSGGEPFDSLAVAAAKQFKFEPAKRGGQPIPVRILYRYVFTPPVPIKRDPVENVVGEVYQRWDKSPLVGVEVTLVDLGLSAKTDEAGRFAFTDVPAGKHRIEFQRDGLVAVSVEQQVRDDRKVNIRIAMEPVAETDDLGDIDDVEVVRASRVRKEITETVIQREEAQSVAGTQGDVVKVVQTLGGVARAAAGTGDLVVWGASPSDTRLYVDGVPVPRLFHVGGSRSILGPQLVSSVSLVPGGFGAPFGRAIGGLVQIETAGPTDKPFETFASIDPIDVGVGARSRTSASTSTILSGRKSLQDQSFELLGAEESGGLVPIADYWDYQAKVHHRLSPSSSVDTMMFGAHDTVNRGIPGLTPDSGFSEEATSSFHRIASRLEHVGEDDVTRQVSPWFGVDHKRTLLSFGEVEAFENQRVVLGGLRVAERRRIREWFLLESGLDFEVSRTTTRREGAVSLPAREGDVHVFGQPPGDRVNLDKWAIGYAGVGAYTAGLIELGEKRWILEPGLRIEPSILNGNRVLPARPTEPEVGYTERRMALDPRLKVTWKFIDSSQVFAAAGRYHQPVAAGDLSPIFGSPVLEDPEATHLLSGIATSPATSLTFEVTGFFIRQSKLPVRSALATPPTAGLLTSEGEGRNYGVQLAARFRPSKELFAWATYSLMRAERKDHDDQPWRLFDFDQTHVVQAVTSWTHSSGLGIGGRLQLSSGFPRTPVTGAVFNTRSGTYDPIFGEQNSTRIPLFVQLSVRVAWEQTLSWGSYKLWLDIQNVTNRRNAEEIIYTSDFSRQDFITGLPVLPLVGAEVVL